MTLNFTKMQEITAEVMKDMGDTDPFIRSQIEDIKKSVTNDQISLYKNTTKKISSEIGSFSTKNIQKIKDTIGNLLLVICDLANEHGINLDPADKEFILDPADNEHVASELMEDEARLETNDFYSPLLDICCLLAGYYKITLEESFTLRIENIKNRKK